MGIRDTDRDIRRSSRTHTDRELARLDKAKADIGWVEGKVEVIMTKFKAIEKRVDDHNDELGVIAKLAATAKNRASEATKAASADHECTHKSTLTNIKKDITMLGGKVDSWDKIVRKAMFAFVGALVVFGGGLVTWLVMHNNLSNDVITLSKDRVEDRKVLDEVKTSQEEMTNTLKQNKQSEVIYIKAAMEQVLEDRDKKNNAKSKNNKRRNKR